ncbi:hypothetical protein, partial [Clostridium botulinum]|uniref:hypothetical protein n=1 Tax=Clostridium botulinum TaxID=1491 RepID=UPI001C9B2839
WISGQRREGGGKGRWGSRRGGEERGKRGIVWGREGEGKERGGGREGREKRGELCKIIRKGKMEKWEE